MVCLGPRDPVDIAGPRALSGVVVLPLNFTVRARQERHHSVGRLRGFMLTVAIFAAAWALYSRVHTPRQGPESSEPQSQTSEASEPQSEPQPLYTPASTSESQQSPFQCDGRTYCSQMTSCAEAKYFLEHCPNVKMDGDHDGVPCERQWCPGG